MADVSVVATATPPFDQSVASTALIIRKKHRKRNGPRVQERLERTQLPLTGEVEKIGHGAEPGLVDT